MRTKQSAIRRLANSEDEDEAMTSQRSPEAEELRFQPQTSTLLTTVNSHGQQQLEDGTVVVQPEAAEAIDDGQVGCFDQAATGGARCSAPGIYDTIKCTACGKRVNPYNRTMEVHPLLKVLVCQKCYKFYASGHFDADEEGKENQCRWCGEGGSLICCDNCEHSFCRPCIKRNLGRSALQDIESLPEESVWLCYGCDQGALRHLQEEANIVMKAVKDYYKDVNRRSEKFKVSQAAKKSVAIAAISATATANQSNNISSSSSHQVHSQHRVSAVPTILMANPTVAPAIAAYGSVRVASVVPAIATAATTTTTIGGINLDMSSIPKVTGAIPAVIKLPQQQPHRNPHNHHANNHQGAIDAAASSLVPGTGSQQRTEFWYRQNVRVETILADIESVDERNIGVALNATVSLLQGMMRQYSRFMQDLTAARSQNDRAQVVARFKSAYRMHLFLRLGRLRSLIAEEDKHLQMRKSAAARVAAPGAATPGAAASAVIDLTGGASAPRQQSRPQQAAAASSLQLPTARTAPASNRPTAASRSTSQAAPPTSAQATPLRQQPRPPQQQLQPPPPELIVVLSDDDDDDENNNTNGNGQAPGVGGSHKAGSASASPSFASPAPASPSIVASTAAAAPMTATANGGKPAGILELLEARRRREKVARKAQLPRRIAAVGDRNTWSGDGEGYGDGESVNGSYAEQPAVSPHSVSSPGAAKRPASAEDATSTVGDEEPLLLLPPPPPPPSEKRLRFDDCLPPDEESSEVSAASAAVDVVAASDNTAPAHEETPAQAQAKEAAINS